MLKKEYAEFLAELRQQLLTQPTDGNRNPRFWGIKQKKRIYGVDPEYADGWEVWDGEDASVVGIADDAESVIAAIKESFELTDDEITDSRDIEDIVEWVNEMARQNSGHTSRAYTPFDLVCYKDEYRISEDALFLTKAACEQHIAQYGYNYCDPHPYVMTADKCPEYEMLLKIITETEW